MPIPFMLNLSNLIRWIFPCNIFFYPTLPYPTHCPTLPYPTQLYPLPYPSLPYPTLYPIIPYPLPYPSQPCPTLPNEPNHTLSYPTLPYPTLPYPTLTYTTLTLSYPLSQGNFWKESCAKRSIFITGPFLK